MTIEDRIKQFETILKYEECLDGVGPSALECLNVLKKVIEQRDLALNACNWQHLIEEQNQELVAESYK